MFVDNPDYRPRPTPPKDVRLKLLAVTQKRGVLVMARGFCRQ